MNEYMYCLASDFQPYIKNLPSKVTLIQCQQDHARFFKDDADLILDCKINMWVRTQNRKVFRKVLYYYFKIEIPSHSEHYILYHICKK